MPPAAAPASPTPIPTNPLPPGGVLPPAVPPIVNPSPAPGGGGQPPIVPPIVNPSPAPGGGVVIPTTPVGGTTPPVGGTTPPGTTGGVGGTSPPPATTPGGLPPGLQPPITRPASYMAYGGPAASVGPTWGSDGGQPVQITGPYSSTDAAAQAARTAASRGVGSTNQFMSTGSSLRGSNSILAQQPAMQQQQLQRNTGAASSSAGWGSSLASRLMQVRQYCVLILSSLLLIA